MNMKKICIILVIIVIALIYIISNNYNKYNSDFNSYNFIKNSISNEKKWDEKDIIEQFNELLYKDAIYCSTDKKIDKNDIKKYIDTVDIRGWESSEILYKKQIELYLIKGMPKSYAVAVKFEDDENYYMYAKVSDFPDDEEEIIMSTENTNI